MSGSEPVFGVLIGLGMLIAVESAIQTFDPGVVFGLFFAIASALVLWYLPFGVTDV